MKLSGKGFYRELCSGIRRDFTGNERVLELACGTGQLTFLLCDKVRSFVATDFSENMVSEARRLYCKSRRANATKGIDSHSAANDAAAVQADAARAESAAADFNTSRTGASAAGRNSSAVREGLSFEVQDATALTYPDNSFDVVIIANALHIMPDPELALQQIRRVLRHGGVLYAPTFAQREGGAVKPWIRLFSLFGFKTFNRWSAAQLTAMIESQGFSVVCSDLMDAGLSPLARLKAVAR